MDDLRNVGTDALLFELMCRMKQGENVEVKAWTSRLSVARWECQTVKVAGMTVDRWVEPSEASG